MPRSSHAHPAHSHATTPPASGQCPPPQMRIASSCLRRRVRARSWPRRRGCGWAQGCVRVRVRVRGRPRRRCRIPSAPLLVRVPARARVCRALPRAARRAAPACLDISSGCGRRCCDGPWVLPATVHDGARRGRRSRVVMCPSRAVHAGNVHVVRFRNARHPGWPRGASRRLHLVAMLAAWRNVGSGWRVWEEGRGGNAPLPLCLSNSPSLLFSNPCIADPTTSRLCGWGAARCALLCRSQHPTLHFLHGQQPAPRRKCPHRPRPVGQQAGPAASRAPTRMPARCASIWRPFGSSPISGCGRSRPPHPCPPRARAARPQHTGRPGRQSPLRPLLRSLSLRARGPRQSERARTHTFKFLKLAACGAGAGGGGGADAVRMRGGCGAKAGQMRNGCGAVAGHGARARPRCKGAGAPDLFTSATDPLIH